MQKSASQREKVALLTAAALGCVAFAYWRLDGGSTSAVFPALRWAALAALIAYGSFKRTLTAWIFIAMLLGAEIGHDAPNVATNLRVSGLIFLRLIKTIIAPLLFATLVIGIAGHSTCDWGTAWAAVDRLFRDRHHDCDGPRPGRYQPDEGRRGSALAAGAHLR